MQREAAFGPGGWLVRVAQGFYALAHKAPTQIEVACLLDPLLASVYAAVPAGGGAAGLDQIDRVLALRGVVATREERALKLRKLIRLGYVAALSHRRYARSHKAD
jgi:hypothetical protein